MCLWYIWRVDSDIFEGVIVGRTKVEVDKNQLVEQINIAESNGPFSTRQELAIAVASSNWALNNNITTSVVITRIAEFGITPLTPKGKRGRQSGQVLSQDHKDKLLAGRGTKVADPKWIGALKKSMSACYFPIIDKIETGSLKAMIKLKCLECTNENKSEIRGCTILGCPLWGKRPYK